LCNYITRKSNLSRAKEPYIIKGIDACGAQLRTPVVTILLGAQFADLCVHPQQFTFVKSKIFTQFAGAEQWQRQA
jgi:hypothetical protein